MHAQSTFFFLLRLIAFAGLFSTGLLAQTSVPVKIWGSGSAMGSRPAGEPAKLDFSATFERSLPTVDDEVYSKPGSRTAPGAGGFAMDPETVLLLPNKTYVFTAVTEFVDYFDLRLAAPAGYLVEINGEFRSQYEATFTANYSGKSLIVRIVGASEALGEPVRAGMGSSLGVDRIHWEAGLGALLTGGSAGKIYLLDAGTAGSWSHIFTPAIVSYESPSPEVVVYRSGGWVRQILAPETAVDIIANTSTQFDIKFYHRDQAQGSSFPRTFIGLPFVTYRFEQGGTATTLKATRMSRNLTSLADTSAGVITAISTLARSGSAWPDFTWTRRDWCTDGQTPLTEVVSASSGSGGTRNHSTAIRGYNGGAVVETGAEVYTAITGAGEQLTSRTDGTSTGLTTTSQYHTAGTPAGSLGQLQSQTDAGGGWTAYDYYEVDDEYDGMLHYLYRPFGGSPTTATRDPGQGEVTCYEYSLDPFGFRRRPSLIETKVGGTLVGKAEIAYADAGSINGHVVVTATRTDHTSTANSLVTLTRYYRENVTEFFLRNQIHSVTRPDGVKLAYAYQRGSLSGTTFSKSGNAGLDAGEASRLVVITGSSSSGNSMTNYDGYDIDPLFLVTDKSTMEVVLRDKRAEVVRTESYVWNGSTWNPVGWTNYTYNFAGQLTDRVFANGGAYAATFNGQQLVSETDETGVKLVYGYDVEGRLETVTKEGGPVTKYTRNAAGRVTATTVLATGTSEEIVTGTGYDTAGRLTSVTPAGQHPTGITYNPGSRTRTTTAPAPDNGTTVETWQLDGRLDSITGSAVISQDYAYSVDDGQILTQVNHGSAARWQKHWRDWLGRVTKSERPGFTGQPTFVERFEYHPTTGLLTRSARVDGSNNRLYADVLYLYDELGQVSRHGYDIGNSGSLVDGSLDMITAVDRRFENYAGGWWLREEIKTFPNNNSNASHTQSLTRTRLTGFGGNRAEVQVTTTNGAVITQTVAVNSSAKTVTTTTSQAGINSRTETVVNGVATSVTGPDGLVYTTGYDLLGRPNTAVDPRTGTTTTTYHAGTAMPETVTDAAGLLASFAYDTSGRKKQQGVAGNKYARFAYNERNQLRFQWGDTVTPVEYVYDPTSGELTSQKTYRGGTGWSDENWPAATAGAADTVGWSYDGPSGSLHVRTEALGAGHTTTYNYNARGQTYQRIAARSATTSVTTTYSYDNNTGLLTDVGYSDGTTPVSYRYNRQGHAYEIDDATGTRAFDRCACGRVNTETLPAGFYGTRYLTYQYETSSGVMGRYQGFKLGASPASSSDLEQIYAYSGNGRLNTLATKRTNNGVSRTFQYGYLANSPLVETLMITGGHAFGVTRGYHPQRDLLTSVDAKWGTASQTRYDYTYNARLQRETAKQSGAAFADYHPGSGYTSTFNKYAYNDRGEVESARRYRGDTATATPPAGDELPGRRFEYRYDQAGNRLSSGATGTSNGAVDASGNGDDNYTANAGNQYTFHENNAVQMSGTVAAGATAAADGTAAFERRDRAWGAIFTPANASAAVVGTATIYAAISGSPTAMRAETKEYFVPKRAQEFDYDYTGNLRHDSVWDYTYDAENRLVAMQHRSEVIGTGKLTNDKVRRLEFMYDYLGRRVRKIVRNGWNGSSFATMESNRKYLYDDWNMVAEFDATSTLTLVRSYTWGLDTAGSFTATGGVGALLQIRDEAQNKTLLPTYDGNGNVAALVDADTGTLAATYEYGPFGESLRAEGAYAAANPFRFSTKFTDGETGLVYYGHRYYSVTLGRFINRDPIGETGGVNLYGFVGNDGVNRGDYLGLDPAPLVDGPWWRRIFPKGDQDDPTNVDPLRLTTFVVTPWDALHEEWRGMREKELTLDWISKFVAPQTFEMPANDGPSSPDAPNNPPRLSDEDCAKLKAKIANATNTLAGMVHQVSSESLASRMASTVWDAASQTALYSNLSKDFAEGGYRMAKLGLDAAGMSNYRKDLASLYKGGGGAFLNKVEVFNNVMDAGSIAVDVYNRDGLGFISHSSSVALNFATANPALKMAISGFKFMWDGESSRAMNDVSAMDETSRAAYSAEQSRNAVVGMQNVQQWQKEFADGGCK